MISCYEYVFGIKPRHFDTDKLICMEEVKAETRKHNIQFSCFDPQIFISVSEIHLSIKSKFMTFSLSCLEISQGPAPWYYMCLEVLSSEKCGFSFLLVPH